MYKEADNKKVWNGFRQMENYLKRVITVFAEADAYGYSDQKGRVYLDATSNMLSSILGHNIKEIKDSILAQYQKIDSCSLLQETTDVAIDYTRELLNLFNGFYGHIFYTNSGSESCDTAVKIAQQYYSNQGLHEKIKIISLEGAYHGSTIAATFISNDEYDKRHLKWGKVPVLQVVPPRRRECPESYTQNEWVTHGLDKLKKLIEEEGSDTIAAIIVEPIQLSNAVAVIAEEYFEGIKEICIIKDILFIADEVATGFGHTGTMFACDKWKAMPDMIMFSKAVTNGVIPMGGVLTTQNIYQKFCGYMDSGRELSHGFTSGGNALGCAAALATLQYMKEHRVLENVKKLEKYFNSGLKMFNSYHFVESADGVGFMFGIKFKDLKIAEYNDIEVGAFIEGALKSKGVLVYYEGFGKMFITPALTSTVAEIHTIIKTANRVFKLAEGLLV